MKKMFVEFEVENDFFQDDLLEKIALVLEDAANKVRLGGARTLLDGNGNKIGYYQVKEVE